ncbi:DUF4112 domain-containing protein [Kiritimatiellaeota bacterium B1221]|nr:DUF4112 domain-containing protein [Kiritimatiellaeota bacterium B1221]
MSLFPHPSPLTDHERNRLQRLSRMMDTHFHLPGTNIHFGFDALIGLIPGIGDGASMLLSLYPLKVAHQHRYSSLVKLRILFRILIDFLIGLVPVIGDAFDVWYKCIKRNVEDILREDQKLRECGITKQGMGDFPNSPGETRPIY